MHDRGRRKPARFSPVLSTPLGSLHQGDALSWMQTLPAGCARLIVADPPYSIGRASWDRFSSRDQYLDWTHRWITEARRLLDAEGTMYVCGYPEPMSEIAARVGPLFASWRCLVWYYRNKASMRRDWGRSHESVLHLRKGRDMLFNVDDVRQPYNSHTRKYPERTQASTSQYGPARGGPWRPHAGGARPRDVLEIPTLCNGSAEKTLHPTQKPVELIRRLVLASSAPGDLVIDPFGGSGTTYAVCEAAGRRWLGCERERAYVRLIASRLVEPGRFRARQADEAPGLRARRRQRLRDGARDAE